MATVSELVMPKLGLTMTEGRIAHWAVAPGARFAKGACIVEIETDKIVNEVAAPADGRLVEHVAATGDTVDVGVVIARWQLDEPDASSATDKKPRVIATPYARRLAREAGVVIAELAGSGPGGRIKAADVQRASAAASKPRTEIAVALPVKQAEPLVPKAVAAAFATSKSLIVVDIDGARLIETEAGLQRGSGRIGRCALATIAALRALERVDPARHLFKLGVGIEADAAIDATTGLSGRDVCARLDSPISTSGTGDIIVTELPAARLFAPILPGGWSAVLAIGCIREVARRGRSGQVAWGQELSLALSYDPGRLSHADAATLIEDIASALTDPLHLLAS